MDSLTQAVLGATIGEVVLGKKIGNKAPLWGAIAGTIPDLDVALNFFIGEVQGTLWHRTFSHSLVILALVAPVFGYLVYLVYRKSPATLADWTLLFFAGLITHPLLDGCTNYGTMLLFPFSTERFSWRTIFIIDPLYTLPLLIAVLLALFIKRHNPNRQKIAWLGLGISSIYLLFTFYNKSHVGNVVAGNLRAQNIAYQKYMTSPAFFNNLLWSIVAKVDEGYQVGYYSLLDSDKRIKFKFIPQNKALLQPYLAAAAPKTKEEIEDLINFTEQFYAMGASKDSIYLNDLRFGIATGWFDLTQDFIFSFHIFMQDGEVTVKRASPELKPSTIDFERLFKRTKGN